MRRLSLAALLLAAAAPAADLPARILPDGHRSADRRLGPPVDLNGYFPFTPPAGKDAWEARRRTVREQLLVASGLWPLPERGPIQAIIHSPIDRDGYTIEKVSFASLPGHYVTGNLYRPKDATTGKHAAVLFPHGHWPRGRFHDAGEKEAKKQVAAGAERTVDEARFFIQALPAQLARMGCVVFHYDMVGYADSTAIGHYAGFTDAESLLRLQSTFGLQTWNSLRALDFIYGLPDVDATRIGVTGASGGGTQTLVLCGIDDRPAVAFPAVMVSTAMQGGCICENAPYLRLGTGNVELAALFAPKPLGMTGANDWTREIETKGFPELRALYGLYGAEDRVMAKCFPQFGHNYNRVSREVMYNWFNRYLKLGQPTPVAEQPFVPAPPAELSVYDAQHPRPKDETDAAGVRKWFTAMSDRQMQALEPKDAASLGEFRKVVGTALRVMLNDSPPTPDDVEEQETGHDDADGLIWRSYLIGRKGRGEAVPAVGLCRHDFDGTVVVWVHPAGKASLFDGGKLVPAAQAIVDRKAGILALDAFGTGELKGDTPRPVNEKYAGFTFGYNRSLLAERVHDVLTAVAFAHKHPKTKAVHLVGWESAGPWVVLARAASGDAVGRTAADLHGFRFEQVKTNDDPMMLPGALKYGGLPTFAALCAPGELFLHNHADTGTGKLSGAGYAVAEAAGKLRREPQRAEAGRVVEWLLR